MSAMRSVLGKLRKSGHEEQAEEERKEVSRLPRDPESGEALPARAQPGYYPGYSTLSQQDYWDETTRNLVLKRVHEVPPIRFFSEAEAIVMQAVFDRILPQDDRVPERRISILNYVDQRLHDGKFDGYIYEGMPLERDAHRWGVQAIEEMARELHGESFANLGIRQQEELLLSIREGKPRAAREIWRKMSPKIFWSALLQDAAAAYYAHPYAWDEIGFGGPAYPRGYMRQENGRPEPWEVDEKRYEWLAPSESISDAYEPNREIVSSGGTHGQEQSH